MIKKVVFPCLGRIIRLQLAYLADQSSLLYLQRRAHCGFMIDICETVMYENTMSIINLNDYREVASPLSTVVRVGDFHRKFARYHSHELLPDKRAVIDAYNVTRQSDLIRELRANGYELTLDTRAAELACPFKWRGQAAKANWLDKPPSRELIASDFNSDMARRIAELAIQHKFHVVLAPSRYISMAAAILTLEQDFTFINLLRRALDNAGGKNISIASSFISRLTTLGDEKVVQRLTNLANSAPIDSLWLRLSGLQREPGPSRTRITARRLYTLQEIGLPIVLDYAVGLGPMALLTLGAAGGICHGVLNNDKFSDDSWLKPSKSAANSLKDTGRRQFARAPGLGRNFSQAELELMSAAPNGRRLLLDPSNTGLGSFDDFKKQAKELALRESGAGIQRLSLTPDLRRPDVFVNEFLEPSAQKARLLSGLKLDHKLAEKLKIKDVDSVSRRLRKHSDDLYNTCKTIAVLEEKHGSRLPRPVPLQHKGIQAMNSSNQNETP